MSALLGAPWLSVLGWALVHFLWEGALVALVTALALRLLRDGAPALRHSVAVLALVTMAALPAWRVARSLAPKSTPSMAAHLERGRPLEMGRVLPLSGKAPSLWTHAEAGLERTMPKLILLWMAGALAFTLRLAGGWAFLQHLRWKNSELAPDALQGLLLALCRKAGLRRAVTLLSTTGLAGPSVVGFLRPAILVPAGWFLHLPPEHVEALLAHELAHVLRHDYLVNLLQSVLEVLFFYHPGVWWLSHRIRAERELACDAFATRLLGDPVPLAEALAHLERRGLSARRTLEPALAAHGGSLMQRITALLLPPAHSSSAPRLCALAVISLLCAAGFRLVAHTVSEAKARSSLQEAAGVSTGAASGYYGSAWGDLKLRRKNALDAAGNKLPFTWTVDVRAKDVPLYQVWKSFQRLMVEDQAYGGMDITERRDGKVEGPKVTIDLKDASRAEVQTTLEQCAKDLGVTPYKPAPPELGPGPFKLSRLTAEDGSARYSLHAQETSLSNLDEILEAARKVNLPNWNGTLVYARDTDKGAGPKVDAVYFNLTLEELESRIQALKASVR